MRSLRFHIHGIQRRAAGHEEPVPLGAAEADVAANLRQLDLADAFSVGGKNMNPVVAVADPAGAGPDVSFDIRPDPVREASLVEAIELHGGELFAVGEGL